MAARSRFPTDVVGMAGTQRRRRGHDGDGNFSRSSRVMSPADRFDTTNATISCPRPDSEGNAITTASCTRSSAAMIFSISGKATRVPPTLTTPSARPRSSNLPSERSWARSAVEKKPS